LSINDHFEQHKNDLESEINTRRKKMTYFIDDDGAGGADGIEHAHGSGVHRAYV
jgi:hypothetical protein